MEMKEYIKPDMQVAQFDKRDSILTLSGTNPTEALSTWGSRADTVDASNIFD